MHVIMPETVWTYSRKYLCRKFSSIVMFRNRGVQYSVRSLPVCKFMYGFACQCVGGRGELIEALAKKVSDISPPLSPLSVRTIKIIVPHVDIKCPDGFLPVSVEEVVGASESAFEFTIISGLSETKRMQGYACILRVDHIQVMTIQPSEGFVFLISVAGDVFCV